MNEGRTEIQLEDQFEDVLTKAAMGQGLTKSHLAELSGLPLSTVQGLFRGRFSAGNLQTLAPYLGLNPQKLLAMATGQSHPKMQAVDALSTLSSHWKSKNGDGMWVNNYITIDSRNRQAILFDAGVDAEKVLSKLHASRLNLAAIFITHTHRDHVEALPKIALATACPLIFSPSGEPSISAAVGIRAGDSHQIGNWSIRVLASGGHSPDGLSYAVENNDHQPLAFVGDAVFALSMGGARHDYARARKEVYDNILSLAPETILCPGHGPLSTVQHELTYNPFF